MGPEIEPYLIQKFLKNECLPDEADRVADFLKNRPDLLDRYFDIEDWENAPAGLLPEENKYLLKKRIDRSMVAKSRVFLIKWSRYAAAAVLLAAILITFLRRAANPPVVSTMRHTIANMENANKDTTLPDGSLVRLTPGSRLSYGGDYLTNRLVTMEQGLARFEEKKVKDQPFTVQAENIATVPVGTIFWVDNRIQKKEVAVILDEGIVQLNSVDSSKKMRQVVLQKGQQVLINVETMEVTLTDSRTKQPAPGRKIDARSPVDSGQPSTAIVWTNDKIQFNQAALPVVLDKIADQYNLKLVFDRKKIAKYHFTGEVYYNDNAEKLIRNICDVDGLECLRKGDTLLIQ
jgi:ferric-dicitrate binding protein FerR (iron transport regulator)